MGTQQDHLVETTTQRTESWRDTLAAKYEIQQAVLRYRISEPGDVEEFL